MTDILEKVARAIQAKMDEQWGEAASDDPPDFNTELIARAAIEAYEAEKREAEKPWADALEEAWFQLNLKDGMKVDQARIHAKTRMNIALNTLGEVRP